MSLFFRFLLHFNVEIGSKLHFFSEKTPNFSKLAPSAPKFWALRAQNFAPPTQIYGGAETHYLAMLGGLAPPRPPYFGVTGPPPFGREPPSLQHL